MYDVVYDAVYDVVYDEVYDEVVCSTFTTAPTTSDFVLFAKPTGPNLTSITGYYAEVEMRNYKTTEISELFSLGTEVFESSK